MGNYTKNYASIQQTGTFEEAVFQHLGAILHTRLTPRTQKFSRVLKTPHQNPDFGRIKNYYFDPVDC